jgi:hypothetical protein
MQSEYQESAVSLSHEDNVMQDLFWDANVPLYQTRRATWLNAEGIQRRVSRRNMLRRYQT